MALVTEMKIPLEKFRWQFKETTYTFPDGTSEPAIQIKGKTTVLCILSPFTKEDSNQPLKPDYTDTKYFSSVY